METATKDIGNFRIAGPYEDGRSGYFVIHDIYFHVWDGKSWRGFGAPMRYESFTDAIRELNERAIPAWVRP